MEHYTQETCEQKVQKTYLGSSKRVTRHKEGLHWPRCTNKSVSIFQAKMIQETIQFPAIPIFPAHVFWGFLDISFYPVGQVPVEMA